jgi:hypothetical protein
MSLDWKFLYDFFFNLLVKGAFSSFWSGLLANLVGLIIGVPIGLWINRRVLRYSERLKKMEQHQKLKIALELINVVLIENDRRLKRSIELLTSAHVAFDTGLDASMWEIVKPDVIQYLNDLRLKASIANYFSNLSGLIKLHEHYLDYAVGLSSLVGGGEDTRESLRRQLIAITPEAIEKAANIHAQIEKFIAPKPKVPRLAKLVRKLSIKT